MSPLSPLLFTYVHKLFLAYKALEMKNLTWISVVSHLKKKSNHKKVIELGLVGNTNKKLLEILFNN